MPDRRVVFISSITAGSKFRTIAIHTAKARAAKKLGTAWSSCKLNDIGGNFQRPSFHDSSNLPARITFRQFMGTWIKVYPPTFNVFNRPCPRAIHTHFSQGNGS